MKHTLLNRICLTYPTQNLGLLISINNIYLFWLSQVSFWPTRPLGYLHNIGTPCHFWLGQMSFWPMKFIGYLNSISTPCHFWQNQMSFWLGYSFGNTFWLNFQFDTWSNRLFWSNCLIKNYTCHLTFELPIKTDMFRDHLVKLYGMINHEF